MVYFLMWADSTLNWLDNLKNQGPLATLILIAFLAGAKKIWYYGHEYDTMKSSLEAERFQLIKDRDEQYTDFQDRIKGMANERQAELLRLRGEADQEARRLQDERERAERRAEVYENRALRLLEAAANATQLAAGVISRRSDGG